MADTRKTIEYKSLKHITQQRVLRLDDRIFVHHDSFKTNPTYNTDNMGKLFVTVFALLLPSRQFCNGSCIQTRASARNLNPAP